jgi:phage baseplate assembly protein W
MPTFIGFNTINQYKKFTLTDFELIKRDLANAFNIQQGELPGRPEYGTTLWSFIFENQLELTETQILNEVRRVAEQDPRVAITDVAVYPQDNGMLIELQLQTVASADAQLLALFFDQNSQRASIV